jgi:hypothetical protein
VTQQPNCQHQPQFNERRILHGSSRRFPAAAAMGWKIWTCHDGPNQVFVVDSDGTIRALGRCVTSHGANQYLTMEMCDGSRIRIGTLSAAVRSIFTTIAICAATRQIQTLPMANDCTLTAAIKRGPSIG